MLIVIVTDTGLFVKGFLGLQQSHSIFLQAEFPDPNPSAVGAISKSRLLGKRDQKTTIERLWVVRRLPLTSAIFRVTIVIV